MYKNTYLPFQRVTKSQHKKKQQICFSLQIFVYNYYITWQCKNSMETQNLFSFFVINIIIVS